LAVPKAGTKDRKALLMSGQTDACDKSVTTDVCDKFNFSADKKILKKEQYLRVSCILFCESRYYVYKIKSDTQACLRARTHTGSIFIVKINELQIVISF